MVVYAITLYFCIIVLLWCNAIVFKHNMVDLFAVKHKQQTNKSNMKYTTSYFFDKSTDINYISNDSSAYVFAMFYLTSLISNFHVEWKKKLVFLDETSRDSAAV